MSHVTSADLDDKEFNTQWSMLENVSYRQSLFLIGLEN